MGVVNLLGYLLSNRILRGTILHLEVGNVEKSIWASFSPTFTHIPRCRLYPCRQPERLAGPTISSASVEHIAGIHTK